MNPRTTRRTAPPPRVRPVKVRLSGEDADVALVAELLAELPTDRIEVGPTSAPYPNRRDPGCRRYLDLYVLDDAAGRQQ